MERSGMLHLGHGSHIHDLLQKVSSMWPVLIQQFLPVCVFHLCRNRFGQCLMTLQRRPNRVGQKIQDNRKHALQSWHFPCFGPFGLAMAFAGFKTTMLPIGCQSSLHFRTHVENLRIKKQLKMLCQRTPFMSVMQADGFLFVSSIPGMQWNFDQQGSLTCLPRFWFCLTWTVRSRRYCTFAS